MLNSILEGAATGVVPSAVYFYWKFLDRRLTDIEARTDWFRRNYEGNSTHGEYIKSTISYIGCYPPKSRFGRFLRYLTIDKGRTEVTIVFDKAIDDSVWDGLRDLIEGRTVRILSYDNRQGKRFLKLRIDGFDEQKVEETSGLALQMIDQVIQEKYSP